VKKIILSVGYPSFPLGFAQVQRQMLLAKALLLAGIEVIVLCRYGIHNQSDAIESEGNFEGINYIYCTGTSIRPDGYLKRNLLKVWGLLNEIKYFWKFSRTKQLTGILISTNSFHNILIYYAIGKILRVKTTVDNVEHWTSIKGYKRITRIEKYLYDKFYFLFTDNIICISDFLIEKVGDFKKGKIIKIPVITDFDKFISYKADNRLINDQYLLYCGSEAYFDVIDFLISSFEKANLSNITLILVTKLTLKLEHRIQESICKNGIKVMYNLPYNDLVNLYMNSEALIIPLRNTDEDRARFPHKISEYCASGRPIITNYAGEICNYFNETNAYICADYDEQEFANVMQKVISEPAEANRIARESYKTGSVVFNYKTYTNSLINLFIKS
jgi:glycosyltransferase involved in cell wall biosynthesis